MTEIDPADTPAKPSTGAWMESWRFGPREIWILAAVLVLSALSARALFADGSDYLLQTLLDPLYYSHNQYTPRRLFALAWDTWPVRLIGLIDGSQIELATIAYGVTTSLKFILPAVVIARSRLPGRTRAILVAMFFMGSAWISNFVVSEAIFALAATTIFVTCSLDRDSDPRGLLRLAAAIALLASYEIVAISNILLALSAWRLQRARPNSGVELALPWVLLAAVPFQVGWYLHSPVPELGGPTGDPAFTFALTSALVVLICIIVLLKALSRWPRAVTVALVAIPSILILSFFTPIGLGTRTSLFQNAYASRSMAIAMICSIALLPIVLDRSLWSLPTSVLNWLGDRTINAVGLAIFLLFCGVSVLGSLDAFSFRKGLEDALMQREGAISLDDCEFCLAPKRQGVADLGWNWTWPNYTWALSMHHRDRPVAVVYFPDMSWPQPFSIEAIEAFAARRNAELQAK